MGRNLRNSSSKNQKKANEENKESTTNRVETSEKIAVSNDEESVLFEETTTRNDEKNGEGTQAILSSLIYDSNVEDQNVINDESEDSVTMTSESSDNDSEIDEDDNTVIVCSNTLVNLKQGENNVSCNEKVTEKIKEFCQKSIDKIDCMIKKTNTKGKEIARNLAKHLMKNSSDKLYSLESRPRSTKSLVDKSVSVNNILFIKASPCLLVAYSEMQRLWKNGSTQRSDTSFKIFTRDVFNALVKLDKNLDSVENFTLRKVHKNELKNNQNLLYWLDPIPVTDVVANTLEIATSSKVRQYLLYF
jgi:hypothetical protein